MDKKVSPIFTTKHYSVYFRHPLERVSRVYACHISIFLHAKEIALAAERDFGYEVEIIEEINNCLYRSWK